MPPRRQYHSTALVKRIADITTQLVLIMIEVETKFRLQSRAEIGRLSALVMQMTGVSSSSRIEDDIILDTIDGRLTHGGCLLRLRAVDGGPAGTFTFKGAPTFAGAAKSRTEIEVAVSDTALMQQCLEVLGLVVRLRYRKVRRVWRIGAATVSLDELDIGLFCEIEGPPEQISEIADRLGLNSSQVETESYPELVLRSASPRTVAPFH